MTRATGWTDSVIHSSFHWAIMNWATERTDSEIHSFSHWATWMTDQPTNRSVDRPTDQPIDRPTDWLPLIILFYVDNIIQAKSCLQMVQGGGENVVAGQIARSKIKLTNHRSTKHIPFYATMWIPRCSFAVSRRRPFPEQKRSTVIQHRYTLTYE